MKGGVSRTYLIPEDPDKILVPGYAGYFKQLK